MAWLKKRNPLPGVMQKARERLGDTTEKVLRWLLRFAWTDLSKLSEGQWLDFEEEFHEFLRYAPPASRKKITKWPRPPEMTSFISEWSALRGLAEESQANLRAWLERLMQTHELEFDPMPLTLRLRRLRYFVDSDVVKDSKLPEQGGLESIFQNAHQVFAYLVAHILAAHCGRLRRCTECQIIFLVDRRQQVFCSSRCLNKVTQRRWRANQPKKTRKKKLTDKSGNVGSIKGGASHGKSKR